MQLHQAVLPACGFTSLPAGKLPTFIKMQLCPWMGAGSPGCGSLQDLEWLHSLRMSGLLSYLEGLFGFVSWLSTVRVLKSLSLTAPSRTSLVAQCLAGVKRGSTYLCRAFSSARLVLVDILWVCLGLSEAKSSQRQWRDQMFYMFLCLLWILPILFLKLCCLCFSFFITALFSSTWHIMFSTLYFLHFGEN